MFVTLYFIPVLYLHVWIRIHKTPEYGSGSITLHIKAWENIGTIANTGICIKHKWTPGQNSCLYKKYRYHSFPKLSRYIHEYHKMSKCKKNKTFCKVILT